MEHDRITLRQTIIATCTAVVLGASGYLLAADAGIPKLSGVWQFGQCVDGTRMKCLILEENDPLLTDRAKAFRDAMDEAAQPKYDCGPMSIPHMWTDPYSHQIQQFGDRIVFTSVRDGDLDLYTMNIDGTDVKRVTRDLGYDGGAFFSPDGSMLCWRASRPKTRDEVKEYTDLLKQGLVQPTSMELFIANADGSGAHSITSLGKANWAPSWAHDGKKLIFASNHTSERGFPFTVYMINTDGTGLEQVSFSDAFDAFPMFSPNGRYMAFSSNRGGKNRETNLFLAEWKE